MKKIIISLLLFSIGSSLSTPILAQKKSKKDILFRKISNQFRVLPERHHIDSIFQSIKRDTANYKDQEVVVFYNNLIEICDLKQKLSFINIEAIERAINEFGNQCINDQKENQDALSYLKEHLATTLDRLVRMDSQAVEQAKQLIQIQHQLLLQNPALKDMELLATRYDHGSAARDVMCSRQGMPPNNYSSLFSGVRGGIDASIVSINNLEGDITCETLLKTKDRKNIADLQLHWDGNRALFSSPNEKNKWTVYELDLTTGKRHQVVNLPETDLEFCDATYLPDGKIIVSSNVGYHGVPCVHGSDVVGNLGVYDPKDNSFRRINFDQDGNWNPVIMNNGRVMYTRWEYTDLTHYFSRMVMHMNPDGTENKALYGSGSYFPNSTFDVRPLPNSSSQFLGVISGHHGVARSGRLILFDPAKGRKEEKGMVQEIPYSKRKIEPIIKDYLVDGVWPQFVRPYPINDKFFLVSAKLHPGGLWGLYLVDVYDNLTCLAEFEGAGLNMPIVRKKSQTPPIIPSKINLKDKEATVFIQDIYEGEGLRGVPRGEVKSLRVFAYEYAYIKSISDHDAQGIQSGWDIKRLLGTVPVEEDGSAIFKVPANTPISLQPLDKNGAAIQWMRSWFTPMPGEIVSCVGCHEDQNQIAMPKKVIAAQRKAHNIKQPQGGVRSFTYELEVQPILNKRCVSCHDQESKIDLRQGQFERYKRGVYTVIDRQISKSYLNLMPYVYRQGPEADIHVLTPYEYHASNSELIRMLEKGHYNVDLSKDEWEKLYNWIDFNAPYYGSFDQIRKLNGHDQYERRIELANKYNNGAGVDWRKEISDYAAQLKQVAPVQPTPIKKQSNKTIRLKDWPITNSTHNVKERTIEIAPNVSIDLVWVPAGKFIMGSEKGAKDEQPIFKTTVKDGFWMSKHEITNEQYKALNPEHDSRYIGQFWKDHTTPGYAANLPKQPVIRVSQQEALEFCKQLSKALDLTITLPSETEWEWACRGGKNSDYNFMDATFTMHENLADAQLKKTAVVGVNPRPMSANDPMRKFWDFLPKDATQDDGAMVMTTVGSYLPNYWGLHDMHGNVAEWTRSNYQSYPLKKIKDSDKVVARGGSWIERKELSTSSTRKAFLPWQKVHNVGFRIIVY